MGFMDARLRCASGSAAMSTARWLGPPWCWRGIGDLGPRARPENVGFVLEKGRFYVFLDRFRSIFGRFGPFSEPF